jgi:murein DD-endopeptidase
VLIGLQPVAIEKLPDSLQVQHGARIFAMDACMSAVRRITFVLYCAAWTVLGGCASTPVPVRLPTPVAPEVSVGSEIAMRAIALLGAPYEFGAVGPASFDCSGLVRFVHAELGIPVPRTAAEQFSAAEPVRISALAPGDLLFFRVNGRRVSHVAIYAGEGRFIHAPQTGRPVEFRSIDDGFYRPRLAGAGRLF